MPPDRAAIDDHVRGLVGRRVTGVDYWDVHNYGTEPAEWDFGDWHHAVMGVVLGTDRGPVSVIWAQFTHEYGVEARFEPMEHLLQTGEEGCERVGPHGTSPWDALIGQPILDARVLWVATGPSRVLDADGVAHERRPAEDAPLALRLEFPGGPVWFAAALRGGDRSGPVGPGDEIVVVFREELIRAMGFDPETGTRDDAGRPEPPHDPEIVHPLGRHGLHRGDRPPPRSMRSTPAARSGPAFPEHG